MTLFPAKPVPTCAPPRTALRTALSGALLLSCLACGKGDFDFNDTAATLNGPPYHAYGDSITFGYAVEHPYPYYLAVDRILHLTDRAISGDMACDVPARQIFPNAENPSTANPTLFSLLIGTNDVDIRGAGAFESNFNLCQQAALAWFAIPAEFKVFATANAVTTTGATHLEPVWNARTTDSLGSTVTFPITTAAAGPLYAWYRITDGSAGSFTYTLDGKLLGTLTTATSAPIATANGTGSSLALLRIPNVPAGQHVLRFQQINDPAGSSNPALATAGFVAVGAPPPAATAGLSRVLVGLLPLQEDIGGAPCSATRVPCLAYDADIVANVALLAGDGLNIKLFDAAKYMTGTRADMADAVHPNTTGQREIEHALLDLP